ncbi:HAD family hydrolase [Trinickia dinghuensis]|uniref:ATPase P n=1 Tax=Trinickia dinghuensis TaxID=2291023 RepID=A0A3D8JXH6_9BURK|nr:HAD family hydrolase [Trinickia dinghuensis]RDU97818.1 ATPase P [Trinickia dinghuensis]
MITIDIPGFGDLTLDHLVADYNGSLAIDGKPLDGVKERLSALAPQLRLHIVTGNTYGDAHDHLAGWPVELVCLPDGAQQRAAKRRYVEILGADRVVVIGNGRNDAAMLKLAALGIAILGSEGAAIDAIESADIVVHHGVDALGLLLKPKRLVASLRG